ncbi:Uncharacterised protein [Bordetella pertussis]|nr:Uncharacterised protein [Bordetella pertussis]CFV97402.1 Uncharacterised protein [Bordetella pertussis]
MLRTNSITSAVRADTGQNGERRSSARARPSVTATSMPSRVACTVMASAEPSIGRISSANPQSKIGLIGP